MNRQGRTSNLISTRPNPLEEWAVWWQYEGWEAIWQDGLRPRERVR